MYSLEWDEIAYQFPIFNGCTVEAVDWTNNFFHIMDLIIYPFKDQS